MERQPDHPSGKRVQVNLRLPPAHADRLKLIAETKHRSQSDIVAKMLERGRWHDGDADWEITDDFPEIEPLAEPVTVVATTLTDDQVDCAHLSVRSLPSGATVCVACDARQMGNGNWLRKAH